MTENVVSSFLARQNDLWTKIKTQDSKKNVSLNYRKHWLQKTGSPESEIDKAEFRDETDIADYTLPDFKIRR